jgi:hypothetical protein
MSLAIVGQCVQRDQPKEMGGGTLEQEGVLEESHARRPEGLGSGAAGEEALAGKTKGGGRVLLGCAPLRASAVRSYLERLILIWAEACAD